MISCNHVKALRKILYFHLYMAIIYYKYPLKNTKLANKPNIITANITFIAFKIE